jgi:hypothetical protein
VVTFLDDHEQFHVYQHHDSSPSGMGEALQATLEYAWALPRFEAMDFSAAFVAANKRQGGGGTYLTTHGTGHGDLAYRYLVYPGTPERTPHIRAIRTSMNLADVLNEELRFDGPLAQFLKWANRPESFPRPRRRHSGDNLRR